VLTCLTCADELYDRVESWFECTADACGAIYRFYQFKGSLSSKPDYCFLFD